ncbi:MAG: OmpH family outer membrane protein [Bacteroidia bacterium]|jgi:outer membrane protein|nr:OmpH family outer membrane protein [Bacteroidia bacterium]
MKYKQLIIGFLIALACFMGGWMLTKPNKVVYVNSEKMFNEFVMTKELKNNLEQTLNTRQNILDSLLALRKTAINYKNMEAAKVFENDYLSKKEMFDEQNQALTLKYDKQIWDRINQYLTDYGRKNGYDFILGKAAEGTILYGNKQHEITEELIQYLNSRYETK